MEKQVKFLLVVTIIAISIFGLIAFSQMSGLSIFNFTKIKAGISGYQAALQSTSVSSCQDLTSSDNYELTQDVSSTGMCFNITANNVILDCKGHTVYYGNQSSATAYFGVYSYATSNGTTIKNCTIKKGELAQPNQDRRGVYFYYGFNERIENVNASFNYIGIYLSACSNNTVYNSVLNNNTQIGIYLHGSSNDSITGNTLNDNGDYGIMMDSSSMYNILTLNTLKGNIDGGIYVLSVSNYNKIYNNFLNNTLNARDDSSIGNYWNMTITPGTNIIGGSFIGGNWWSDYTGVDDGTGRRVVGDGIGDTKLPYNASSNIITGGDYLPLVYPSGGTPLSCGATITSNFLLIADMQCNETAIIIGANNVTFDCNGHNITGNGSGYGIYLGDSVNVTVKNCKIKSFNTGIRIGTGSWVSTNATIVNNVINNMTFSGVSSAEAYGNNISDNTISNVRYGVSLIWSLNSNVFSNTIENCTDSGVEAGSDGNSGSSIVSNKIKNATNGLYLAYDTFTVKNNEIRSSNFGIKLTTVSDSQIDNNTIEGKGDPSTGISAGSGCSKVNFTGNTIRNCATGMGLSSSDSNLLLGNTIFGLGSGENYGLSISSSSNNVIQDNTITNVSVNALDVYDTSSNDTIISNDIYNNQNGLRIFQSSNHTVTSNNFTNNTYGLFLDRGHYLTVTSNIFNQNSYGLVFDRAQNNSVYNNYFNNTIRNAQANNLSYWNTTKTAGTNIVGGSFIAGNWWSDYTGVDNVGSDGIGDTNLPYNASNNITFGGDYLPLIYVAAGEQVTPSPGGTTGGARTYIPTESEFSVGYSHSMRAGDRLRFTLGTTTHYLEIERIRNGVVTISISSNPIIFNLTAGESKKIDIDSNGIYDILVKAESVSYSIAQIFIQRISEAVSAVPLACSNGCSTYGQKECGSDSLSYRTCGNYDSDTCLEWSSLTSCASGQVCSAGNCILQTLTCSGTEPYGTGVIEGQDNYDSGYMPTSWTYDSSATSSTPCEWKCDAGYVQNGDACQKKTSILVYVLAGIIILALAAGVILLARYYARRKQLRGEILTQKARAFVLEARSKGFSEQAIEQMLLDKGWTDEDIKGCLKDGVKCKFGKKK